MGTLDSKTGNYVGLLAAVLFMITAFVALLMKPATEGVLTDTAQYVLMASGVLALIAGIMIALKPVTAMEKIDGIMLVIFGLVAAIAYVLISIAKMDAPTVVGIVAIMAALAMLAGCATSNAKKQKFTMYVDIIFALIELIFVALIFTKTSLNITEAASFMIAGFWLACHLVMDMNAEPEAEKIDPNRKSAKRAQKQKQKNQAKEKKNQERHEKLEEISKEKKHEHKAAEMEASKPSAEPAKEAEPAPAAEAAPAEPAKKPSNDFMSKLVSSRDASSKAAAVPAEPAKDASPSEPTPVVEEPVAEPEPVVEAPETSAVPEPAAEEPTPVVEEEPVEASDDEEDLGDENLADIYTDYSPEALVRRAAWNKGLRCRRDYGDYHVPVAFVKGKVAVYVEEPGNEDRDAEAKLKEDGWIVLRFDINKVSDGADEGAQIAEAVKSNVRAMKAAKKKKKSAKK